jgi:C1A family cysteine protease
MMRKWATALVTMTVLSGCGMPMRTFGPITPQVASFARTVTPETIQPNTPSKFGGYGALAESNAKPVTDDSAKDAAGPSHVDWRDRFGPVRSQGPVGASPAFAAVAVAEGLLAANTSRPVNLSPRFAYFAARQLLDRRSSKTGAKAVATDTGAYLADAMEALATVGVPTEAKMPYASLTDLNKWTQITREDRDTAVQRFVSNPPTAAAVNEAKRYALPATKKLTKLSQIKQALAAGRPVALTLTVYDSFEGTAAARTGKIPLPETKAEERIGHHAVCAVGYEDETGRLIFRNSWGAKWGDDGYGYLPYSYVHDGLVIDAYTVR